MLIPLGILAASSVAQIRAGYFAGGNRGGAGNTAVVDKYSFPDDTRSTLGTGLSVATQYLSGMANSGVAGYVGQGDSANFVDKFTFPTDSRSTISALPLLRFMGSALANSGVAGYWGNGADAFPNSSRTLQKTAFATDTSTSFGNLFADNRAFNGAAANSGVNGYWAGGNFGGTGAGLENIRKFVFSSESFATFTTTLSSARYGLAGMANSGVAGYFGSGWVTARVSTVDKLSFSAETRSTLGTGLSGNRFALAGMANSGVAGYFGGGDTAGGLVTTVDKFTFSTDARTTLATGLSQARDRFAAMANSGTL
jgi:hypothetical protein